jgi:quinol monooxygenase YgiN
MKRTASATLSLALVALGCGQANRGGSAPTTPASDTSPADVVANPQVPVVRVAELEIDVAQLENYKAAVREEIETSVRIEPGVLAIYAVAEKENPAKLRFFEMYADEAAYKAHIESPHFKNYVTTTQAMIVYRRLIDTVPVQLSAKRK